jgi:hypothetical protein
MVFISKYVHLWSSFFSFTCKNFIAGSMAEINREIPVSTCNCLADFAQIVSAHLAICSAMFDRMIHCEALSYE